LYLENNQLICYSGWLGIILGSKFYINYTKKPFDAAYSETLTELQVAMNATEKKSPKKGIFYSNTSNVIVFFVFSCASTGTTSSILGGGNSHSKRTSN
jgi:hypothetical protein